jgi:hypothetical protein
MSKKFNVAFFVFFSKTLRPLLKSSKLYQPYLCLRVVLGMISGEEEVSNLLHNMAPLWEMDAPGSLLLHDLEGSLTGSMGCEVVPNANKRTRCSLDGDAEEALHIAQHIAPILWEQPRRLSDLLTNNGSCRVMHDEDLRSRALGQQQGFRNLAQIVDIVYTRG